MIAKVSCTTSIQAKIKYADDIKKGAEVISTHLLISESVNTMHKDFEMVQKLNRTCVNRTICVILSWSTKNKNFISNQDLKHAVWRFTEKMNLEQHQHLAIVHRDRNHIHQHVYYNRIDFMGKAYNDSKIGTHAGDAAHEISREMGWISSKDVKAERLDNSKGTRKYLHNLHKKIISDKDITSIAKYVSAFAKANVEVVVVQGKKGKINGFRFNFKSHSFKASEVHRDMSYLKLCNALYSNVESKPLADKLGSNLNANDSSRTQQEIIATLDDSLEELFGKLESKEDLNYLPPIQTNTNNLGGTDEDFEKKKKKKKKNRGIG